VQNEIHPYYQDREATAFIQSKGIVVEAWYPLGGRGHNRELLSDPALAAIAARHGVSLVQVILRWDLQRGVAVVPGSANPSHQKENISLFDFELSAKEMDEIARLDRKEKHDWY
jgi:diketogulonate reductase-like aldo/keto reductase